MSRLFVVCAAPQGEHLAEVLDLLISTSYKKALVISESQKASFPVAEIKPADDEDFFLVIMLTRSQLQSALYAIEEDSANWIVDAAGEHKVSPLAIEQLNCVVAHYYANGF